MRTINSAHPRRFRWTPTAASRSSHQQRRWREGLAVVLAVNSGATDAIGFLALGGAFTSVMTGNMVLLGVALAGVDGALALHTGAAIVCFILGCSLGTRIAGAPRSGDPVWPPAVTRALVVEGGVLTGYAVGWWWSDGHPSGQLQLSLLVLNAVALGIQSSTVQRFGVAGLSTTYLTGTLTTVIARLTSGHRLRDVAQSVLTLLGLITGAALGGLLTVHAPMWAPLVQLGSLGIVLAAAVTAIRPGPDL
ncbi:YoaK family protein [Micromonospora chersina]|uniref:YoaK family protein n=1 Tax=Micromonospora chersina TaxID=47854 RepID=UPI003D8C884D